MLNLFALRLLAMIVMAELALAIPARAADAPTAFDTTKRVPWTTSQVRGAPEPPARYKATQVFSGMKLDSPVDLRLTPDGKRWFVVEVGGFVRSFPVGGAAKTDLVFDLSQPNLPWQFRRQFYSITFHPKFAENGYLYVCYREQRPSPPRTRISRFTVTGMGPAPAGTLAEKWTPSDPPVCAIDSEYIAAEWWAGEDHFGGSLQFGPDGMLYCSVGDGHGYGDGNQSGQDLSDLQASILRLDVDHPDKGRSYGIPKDNPFVKTPGARPEVWAYGLRNIWKMSFDRVTGELWGGEVGQDLWDCAILIERGGNYGWSVVEGTHDFRPERPRGPTPILPPVTEHQHFEARSITGGYVYRGTRLTELVGAYVYGDYDTGKIWAVRRQAGKAPWLSELVDTPLRIVAFAEDQAGELIIVDHTGSLHRLDAEDPAVLAAAAKLHFPRLLSETGLYASTAANRVAPGVIPYSVNSPLWSDDSRKERFMAIPGDGKIDASTKSGWNFPEGTVLVKTFALDLIDGEPTSRQRIETRIMHLEQGHWRGYTYLWNAAQTDAELLDDAAGRDRVYAIRDAKGAERKQTWHFPGRAECTLCHTMPVNYVLGTSTAQLDRLHDYGNGVQLNQIAMLDRLGALAKKPPTPSEWVTAQDLAPLVDPRDASASLDARARAYLHANCAHCHIKWGGGNAYFYLNAGLSLSATNAIDMAPQHGDLGIPNARVIAPGDPDRSLLLTRMGMIGPHRMPRIASSVIDEPAVRLIRAWITSLPKADAAK